MTSPAPLTMPSLTTVPPSASQMPGPAVPTMVPALATEALAVRIRMTSLVPLIRPLLVTAPPDVK
jgi:hypothetical protein